MPSEAAEGHFESRWGEWIQPEWMEHLDNTPFLKSCREGTVSLKILHGFLTQQYFYARHFTRYLCALLSNITNEEDRRELTENLVDETGLGSAGGVPHSVLYRNMLEKFGVVPSQHDAFPATRDLVETMLQSCRNPNPAVGLGALCLGAEAIVPHVYSQIVRGFEATGVDRQNLTFFLIHIGCDDEHALTMKKIIERELTSPEQLAALRCAASRAIAARTRFFNSLLPERCEVHAV